MMAGWVEDLIVAFCVHKWPSYWHFLWFFSVVNRTYIPLQLEIYIVPLVRPTLNYFPSAAQKTPVRSHLNYAYSFSIFSVDKG